MMVRAQTCAIVLFGTAGLYSRGGIEPTGGCASVDARLNPSCLTYLRPHRPECATTLGAAELLMSVELTGLARFFSRAVASSSRPSPARPARQSKTLPFCPPTFSSMAVGVWYVLIGRDSGTGLGMPQVVAVSCTVRSSVRAPYSPPSVHTPLCPFPPRSPPWRSGLPSPSWPLPLAICPVRDVINWIRWFE